MKTSSVQRLILSGAFIVASAAVPAIAAFSSPEPGVPLAQCSGGEEADAYTTTCVPYMVPTSKPLFSTTAANPEIPEVDGVPCVGGSAGGCIGLVENEIAAGPQAVPRSTFSSSP